MKMVAISRGPAGAGPRPNGMITHQGPRPVPGPRPNVGPNFD